MRRGLPVLLLALPVLAGCLGAPPVPGDAGEAPAQPLDRAALRALPRPELLDPVFLEPIDLGLVDRAAEPGVAVAPDGTVYVTTPLFLWRSDDGGRSYQALGEPGCPRGLPACPGLELRRPGIRGGGDGSLAVTPDGRVHWLGLSAADAPIPYQVSGDRGETWSEPVDLAYGNSTDREWIYTGPGGALYAQWRDFGNTRHCPPPALPGLAAPCEVPRGVLVRRSLDGGATWEAPVRATDDNRQGPAAPDPGSPWMYLPVWDGPNMTLDVARSPDAGRTWEDVAAAALPQRPFIFPVAAVDQAGTVYVVYATGDPGPAAAAGEAAARNLAIPEVFLVHSLDRGATWSAPLRLSSPGVPAVFPWIAAGAPGRVAVAWYEAEHPWPGGRLPNVWHVAVAMSTTADQPEAAFKATRVTREPVHVGGLCAEGGACLLTGGDRSLLDFFELRMLPDGAPVLAWAADGDLRQATTRIWASALDQGTRLLGP